MELHHLRYFVRVAETLHFTRAADELFVTQPALSQQIKILESELGAPLFDRSGRKVRLTDVGATFLEYARNALSEVERGARAVADLQDAIVGNVRIGVMYSYFNPLLAVLGDFCAAYPGVKVSVSLQNNEDLHDQLLNAELDIALTFDENNNEELEQKGAFDARLVFAVEKKHPLAELKEISMAGLDQVLLVLPSAGNIIRTILEKTFKKYRRQPLINTEVNDLNLLLDLVETGSFATIVTDIAIAQRKNICAIPIKEAIPTVKGAILVKKNGYHNKATLLLLESILEKMARRNLDTAQ